MPPVDAIVPVLLPTADVPENPLDDQAAYQHGFFLGLAFLALLKRRSVRRMALRPMIAGISAGKIFFLLTCISTQICEKSSRIRALRNLPRVPRFSSNGILGRSVWGGTSTEQDGKILGKNLPPYNRKSTTIPVAARAKRYFANGFPGMFAGVIKSLQTSLVEASKKMLVQPSQGGNALHRYHGNRYPYEQSGRRSGKFLEVRRKICMKLPDDS